MNGYNDDSRLTINDFRLEIEARAAEVGLSNPIIESELIPTAGDPDMRDRCRVRLHLGQGWFFGGDSHFAVLCLQKDARGNWLTTADPEKTWDILARDVNEDEVRHAMKYEEGRA